MATTDGWYLIGPLIAVALVGLLGAVFYRMGLHWSAGAGDENWSAGAGDENWSAGAGDEPPRDLYGLAIFAEPDDYGLLCPAAITDEPDTADEIRLILADAGIRATHAVRPDGRTVVLVFAEELAEARRLVGDSPAL